MEGLITVIKSTELLEERYKGYRERLKKLTLMSDVLGRNVLKDRGCTEYILRIIMNDKKLKVVDQRIQADYKNLHGRSAVLDCVAIDGENREINIELQQEDEGANPKRARYHLGLMDTNILNPGENFDKLPESYVIFITRNDALKKNQPILHISRFIEETGEKFEDESHFIYVDSSKQDDTELGLLMHDLNCEDTSDMQSSILSERVRVFKETEGGIEHMCKEMEEIRNEGYTEGKAEGERNLLTRMISKKLEKGKTTEEITEEIAEELEIAPDAVKGIIAELSM